MLPLDLSILVKMPSHFLFTIEGVRTRKNAANSMIKPQLFIVMLPIVLDNRRWDMVVGRPKRRVNTGSASRDSNVALGIVCLCTRCLPMLFACDGAYNL